MHEIRHLDPVNQEGVLFDRVTHFVRVLGAVGRLRPQVRDRIDDHLEQFMGGGDAHELVVLERGFDEDLRNRLPVLGQVVIAERAGCVGVIEVYELPVRGLRNLGVVKLHRIAPDRQKVLVVTLLQSGSELVERHSQVDRRLVDAGDRDGAALPGLRGMDGGHGTLASDGEYHSRIARFRITIYSCIASAPLFLCLKSLRQPPDGAVDRRKDWRWQRASSKTRWLRQRLLGDLRGQTAARYFDQSGGMLTVAGDGAASYPTNARAIRCVEITASAARAGRASPAPPGPRPTGRTEGRNW